MVFRKLRTYGELILVQHTLFSLPFALSAMLFAARGFPGFRILILVILAFTGARNGANALNRLIDRDIDAENPRTRNRHLPRGIVSPLEVLLLTGFFFSLLVVSAFLLNPLCVKLLPVAIVLFVVYSYTKRFTWACHLILGFISGGASVGGWIAVTGRVEWPCLVLAAANAAWVAGFDIIYGTLDVDFDRGAGLRSIPETFGIPQALRLSSLLHAATAAILVYAGILIGAGWFFYIGVCVLAVLFAIEHRMVTPKNLKGVHIASYTMNQIVGIVFFLFNALDIFTGWGR